MRAPLSWIREFTPVDAAPADIADALNQLGLEVEEIDEPGREINGVVVAKILDVVPHPDADRIRLADVDFGDGQLRVVCGAPNIHPGMVAPFARVGATLPGDFTIERRKIRGVVRKACSHRRVELGLGDDHSGILELARRRTARRRRARGARSRRRRVRPGDHAQPARRHGHHRRRARDRRLLRRCRSPCPSSNRRTSSTTIGDSRVVVEAPDRCPRFVGIDRDVTMGPSPEWMQQRLRARGDASDQQRRRRHQLRHARTLPAARTRSTSAASRSRHRRPARDRRRADGHARRRHPHLHRRGPPDLRRRAEAARHRRDLRWCRGRGRRRHDRDPARVGVLRADGNRADREAARPAHRGERPIRTRDRPERHGFGSDAGDGAVRRSRGARCPRRVRSTSTRSRSTGPASRCARRASTGCSASSSRAEEIRDLLVRSASRSMARATTFTAIAPTFRPDLEREIDIVEEVGRRVGLQNIPRTVPSNPEKIGALTSSSGSGRAWPTCSSARDTTRRTRSRCSRRPTWRGPGSPTDAVIEVENPLRGGVALAAASPPGLLPPVAFNAAHGSPDVALFELGHVFAPPDGRRHAAGRTRRTWPLVRAGRSRAPHEPDRDLAPHDAVAVVQALAEELRLADWRLEAAAAPGFHPVRPRRSSSTAQRAGYVGEIAPDVVAAFDLPAPGRRLRARRRRRSAAAARVAHLRRRVAVPGVRHRPRVRRRRTACPPARCSTRSGPRPATSRNGSSSSTCSAPTRSATGA